MPAARRATPDSLREAAWALRDGRLVVFPTETVYGLGAHARDAAAVGRLFEAKGRPTDNPLIVHVPDAGMARGLASQWGDVADRLARAFWPGPLTLVLPKAPGIADAVTAGLDTVAVRVPRHPVAQALLREAGLPVAAPSANRAGRPSPTRIADAVADLGTTVAVYLDGGPSEVGVESTVVAVLDGKATLLRLGAVPREDVERVAGPLARPEPDGPARSPGMRHRHYAPAATVHLAETGDVAALLARLAAEGRRPAAIVSAELAREAGLGGRDTFVPGPRGDAAAWARALFALLRDADGKGHTDVVVERIAETGLGAAVVERLRRAAEPAA